MRPSATTNPHFAPAAEQASAIVRPKPVTVSPDDAEEHLRHVQRLVMQGELAATAVHEISNLLTIVLFNAGLLRERHKGDSPNLKYIEPILHAATLTTALCGQLRNLARPTEARARTLDLAAAARGTFQLLEQIIARKMRFAAPDGPVRIYGDPAHIDQVLVNLVLNARDATSDETGRIAVSVGRLPGKSCFLEVRDNGSGVTAAVKRQLFRAFFTTKPPGHGTGLGLVTVQRLMRGMGGDIKLSSRPGRGTCVRLTFPPSSHRETEPEQPAGP